jgi:4-hydroxythreonine-4-phosphate dehydrogenase
MTKFRPIIGITIGDIAGIGPEIIVKALSLNEIYQICRPIVIGTTQVLILALKFSKYPLQINTINHVDEGKYQWGTIDVLEPMNIDLTAIEIGKVQKTSGRAAVEYIKKAVQLALNGEIHAITTAPINKEAIHLAGYSFAGHTELLATLTGTQRYAMMLVANSLRVVHVTTHVSLKKACEMITKSRVFNTIILTHEILISLGIDNPRMAVSGLNPHAGESGLFGQEEIESIIPAIQDAKSRGINVQGPFPADTLFSKVETFDVYIVMYHDQGHLPVKVLAFEKGVNVTLGLPIVRTSVDHGTAFDIVGKGIANPQSLVEAIKMAVDLSQAKL